MSITTLDPSQAGLADKANAGIDRISSGAHQAVDRVADAAAAAAQQLSTRKQELYALQDRWSDSARQCVRQHPFASIGVALGIGALLSLISRISAR